MRIEINQNLNLYVMMLQLHYTFNYCNLIKLTRSILNFDALSLCIKNFKFFEILVDISSYVNLEPDNLCKKLLQEREILQRTDHLIECDHLNRPAHLFCLEKYKQLKLPHEFLLLPNTKRIKVVKIDPPYGVSSINNHTNDQKNEKQNSKKVNRIKATCVNKFETEKYCIYGDFYEEIDNFVQMGYSTKPTTDMIIKHYASLKSEQKTRPQNLNDSAKLENNQKKPTDSSNNTFSRSLTETKIETLKKPLNSQRIFNGVYLSSDNEHNKLSDLSNTVLKLFPERSEPRSSNSSSSMSEDKNSNGKMTVNTDIDSFKDVVRTISTAVTAFKTASDIEPKILRSDTLVNIVNKASIKASNTIRRSSTFSETMKHDKNQSIILKLSKYEKFERQQWHQQQLQLQHHLQQQKKQDQLQQDQNSFENTTNKIPNLAKPIIKIKRISSEKQIYNESQRKSIEISYSQEGNYSSTKQTPTNNVSDFEQITHLSNVNNNNLKNFVNISKLDEIEESIGDFKLDISKATFDTRAKTAKSTKSTFSAKSGRSNVSTPKYVIFSNCNNSTMSIPHKTSIKNASVRFNTDETTYSTIASKQQQPQQQVSLIPSMSRSLTTYGFDVNSCKSVVGETKQIFHVNGRSVSINQQNVSKMPKLSFEVTSSPYNIVSVRIFKKDIPVLRLQIFY